MRVYFDTLDASSRGSVRDTRVVDCVLSFDNSACWIGSLLGTSGNMAEKPRFARIFRFVSVSCAKRLVFSTVSGEKKEEKNHIRIQLPWRTYTIRTVRIFVFVVNYPVVRTTVAGRISHCTVDFFPSTFPTRQTHRLRQRLSPSSSSWSSRALRFGMCERNSPRNDRNFRKNTTVGGSPCRSRAKRWQIVLFFICTRSRRRGRRWLETATPSGGVAAGFVCAVTRLENAPRLPYTGRTSVVFNVVVFPLEIRSDSKYWTNDVMEYQQKKLYEKWTTGPALKKIIFSFASQQIKIKRTCVGFATKSFKGIHYTDQIADFTISTSCARTRPLLRVNPRDHIDYKYCVLGWYSNYVFLGFRIGKLDIQWRSFPDTVHGAVKYWWTDSGPVLRRRKCPAEGCSTIY